jgi:hypothetical protein
MPPFVFLLWKITPLIHSTGVWPEGRLITPFYGRLNHDQIFILNSHVTSKHPSPGATAWLSLYLVPSPTQEVNFRDGNLHEFFILNIHSKINFEIFYQNIKCLRTKNSSV